MVKAEETWLCQQHSACPLPNLNFTSTLLQHGQHHNVLQSSMNHPLSAEVAFPGFIVPGLGGLGTGQTNGAHGFFQYLPPRLDILPSTINPHVNEEPSAFYFGHGSKTLPDAVSLHAQKRFVIFDQSGNHTRLFFGPLCSPAQIPIVAPTKCLDTRNMCDEVQRAKLGQIIPTESTIQEKSEENQVIGGESEMHEDTEEINALLYSDDDGDDSEDDEVTSTGRSPFTIGGSSKKREHMEEIMTDVTSSDGPMKRQRLIDGGYKKPSLMTAVSSAKLDRFCEFDDDTESSFAKQSRNNKIRETLKVIESLMPGVKSKDPLVVIEKAISYLKYLKLKAKA